MKIALLKLRIIKMATTAQESGDSFGGITSAEAGPGTETAYRATVWNFPDRLKIDFAQDSHEWVDVESDSDFAQFGTWKSEKHLEILNYCEGDFTLRTFDCWDAWDGAVKSLEKAIQEEIY